MYEKNFVGRISELFHESKLSIKEFSDKVGISRQTMEFYLKGKRSPSAESLMKISKEFEVSTDWLLAITDVKSTSNDIKNAVNALGISEESAKILQKLDQMSKESISWLIEFGSNEDNDFIKAWKEYLESLTIVPYSSFRNTEEKQNNYGIVGFTEDGKMLLDQKAATEYRSVIVEKRFSRLCDELYDRFDFFDLKTDGGTKI